MSGGAEAAARRPPVAALVAGAALLGLLLFWTGLGVGYYGDAYMYVFRDPASRIFHFFVARNPYHQFYRPTLTALMLAVQARLGMDTLPIHLVAIASHAALVALVVRAALGLGLSRAAAFTAGAWMLVAQITGFSVHGPDNLSQVWAALFGALTVWAYHRGYDGDAAAPRPLAVGLALASYLLCVLAKESSVGTAALVGVVTLAHQWRRTPAAPLAALVRAVRDALPVAVLTVAYMAARKAILAGGGQPAIGEGRYDFHLGLNIPVNAAALVSVAMLQVSSVRVMAAAAARDWPVLALAGLLTALVWGAVAAGLWRERRRALPWVLLALALAATLPPILLNHVSELYAYNVLPYLALLGGWGVTSAWAAAGRPARAALAVLLAVALASNVLALREKGRLLTAMSDRATTLRHGVEARVAGVRQGGTVQLVNDAPPQFEYSEYALRGFRVLENGLTIFREASDRPDLRYELVEPAEVAGRPAPDLRLGLAGDSVVVRP